MANVNTVISVPSLSIAAGNANTTAAVAAVNASGVAQALSIPNNWPFSAKPFRIRLMGTYTAGATTTTLKPVIVVGTASATTSNFATQAAAGSNNSTSGTSAGLSGNFLVEVEALFDAASGLLNGSVDSQVCGVFTAPTTATQVTSITQGGSGTSGLNFLPFFTFSAASASNSVTVTEFSIEQL
jgi:hypothetical protein